MSRHIYCAPGVLMTLFQCSLAISKYTMHTDGLDSYITRFPLAVSESYLDPFLWAVVNHWITVS
jgi:hypothetical protein